MIKNDRWIRMMATSHNPPMIEPFEEKQMRKGVISYGVSSYGYDIRIADEFKIFTNINTAIVDPKNFDNKSFVDFKGDVCIIPPNSFALGRSVEYFRIPRNVMTICLGKCLPGDTRVIDVETGSVMELREFVKKKKKRCLSLGEDYKTTEAIVANHLSQGIKPVYELKTKAGRKIKATSNHPFLKLEGWTKLKDLKNGDRIAVPRIIPVFGKRRIPEYEALILGLMISDGQCMTPGYSPSYTTDDLVLKRVFEKAVKDFGCEVSYVNKYTQRAVNRKGQGGLMTKNKLYAWLEGMGLNVRSVDKFIPDKVFMADRESLVTFLRALFSGDGSIYRSEKGVFLEYYSRSERLIRDVHHLLLRFGIVSLLREKMTYQGNPTYSLLITDKEMILRFQESIGFIDSSKKAFALEDIAEFIRNNPKEKSNFDTLPSEAWMFLKEECHLAERSMRGIGIITHNSQSLPYSIVKQALIEIGSPLLDNLCNSDILWDSIVSIEPSGEEEVFDITVAGLHNFIANDIIVHNSTYARCGIITNVTPFEPEWEGYVTIEISNTTPLPARIYANEGIAQVLFFEGDEPPEVSYADKKGKYQAQKGITLPKI